jgi:hypothetical protein
MTIPIVPAPNPANWKTLGDYYQPPSPADLLNLQGAVQRNRLMNMQMQDEQDYRNYMMNRLNPQFETIANTEMVPQEPRMPEGIDPMAEYVPADQPPDVPVTTTERRQVNALAQPTTMGGMRAQQDLANQRVQQFENFGKLVANLRKAYGPQWKDAFKQMQPELVASFPAARSIDIDKFADNSFGSSYAIPGPDGKPTGKIAFIDDTGKTHILTRRRKVTSRRPTLPLSAPP